MAGTSLQRPIGVGPALEKARRIRGLSLDEASRDTRLRADQLTALEDEDFAALPSDAFVRGALRTYAQYLGVSPDKVLGAYARHADEPGAPPPPGGLGRIERAIAATAHPRQPAVPAVRRGDARRRCCCCSGSSRVIGGAPAPAAIPTTAPPAVTASIDDRRRARGHCDPSRSR